MLNFRWMLVFLMLSSVISGYVHASKRIALISPGFSLVQEATYVKTMSPRAPLHFVVWLKMRHKTELDKLVSELYNPNSPQYHQFITGREYEARYAPLANVEKKLYDYFVAEGMQVKLVNHSLRITATVRQVEHSFQTKMNYYRYQQHLAYANAGPLTFESSIAKHVMEVSGLNEMIRFYPLYQRASHQDATIIPHDLNLKWDNLFPAAQPTTQSLNGFTGATLRTAYRMTELPFGINGYTQTVVILDGCGGNIGSTIQSDANAYNTANGISPLLSAQNFRTVIDNNGEYVPYQNSAQCDSALPTGWEDEIALDVEAAHTIATGANMVLVLDPQAGNGLYTVVSDVISTLIQNNFNIAGFSNASIISNSWGSPEITSGASPAMEAWLQVAAVTGIGFNFASGDCGDNTYDNPAVNCTPPRGGTGLSAAYPASSAFVTAVGGTSLFVDNTWHYAFETGWGAYQNGEYAAGSGGGISSYYAIPSPSWQTAINTFDAGGYGIINTYHNCGTAQNQICRAVPDVAMLADLNTGLEIYFSPGDGSTTPSVHKVGGTSVACPLYSATLALVNQKRLFQGRGRLGLSAPYLYHANARLLATNALNLIIPPHQIISGVQPNPIGAPLSSFTLAVHGNNVTFSWDSSLTVGPETQFWNDVVGVGSPNIPKFVMTMADF